MEHPEVIETIGSITKLENLRSFEENVLENTIVLQNVDPFPGFKNLEENVQHGQKPGSIFIILRYKYAPEKINRINKDLFSSRLVKIFPSFGEISTHECIYPCIRIKGIEDFSIVPVLQNFLKRNDLHLMAYRKVNEPGRIKIFKSFRIIEIADGLYRDLNEGEKIYIRIPSSLNWKRFDYISKNIRYNLMNRNFDAALGIIYRFCGPENVIRVYDQDKSLERAILLRNKFIKEVRTDMLISVHQPQGEKEL